MLRVSGGSMEGMFLSPCLPCIHAILFVNNYIHGEIDHSYSVNNDICYQQISEFQSNTKNMGKQLINVKYFDHI